MFGLSIEYDYPSRNKVKFNIRFYLELIITPYMCFMVCVIVEQYLLCLQNISMHIIDIFFLMFSLWWSLMNMYFYEIKSVCFVSWLWDMTLRWYANISLAKMLALCVEYPLCLWYTFFLYVFCFVLFDQEKDYKGYIKMSYIKFRILIFIMTILTLNNNVG